MKIKLLHYGTRFLAVAMLTGLMHAPAFGDYATNLMFSGYIQDSAGDIDVGKYSVPIVYDWNSDGKQDLLFGQRYIDAGNVSHGYVSYYENAGTNASPLFNNSSYIEACNTICNYLDAAAGG